MARWSWSTTPHATGFVGAGGRGTPEYRDVMGRIDILNRHAPAGARRGGRRYTAARRGIVGWLRQRSRPYLFSNSIPPVIAATTLRVARPRRIERRAACEPATQHRALPPPHGRGWIRDRAGEHPIAPVMLGDAALAARFAERLLERGVYVIGFSYRFVPMGKARIRTPDVRRPHARAARPGDRRVHSRSGASSA